MPTKTAEKISMPGFRYGGFDIPSLDLSASLIDGLGTSEPVYKLASKSAPLQARVGLYLVGRDLEFGVADAEALPSPVKEAGRMVYSDNQARKGIGTWHKDGVLFLPRSDAPKGTLQPDDYAFAKYFKDIEGFEQNGRWKIKPSDMTEETNIWVPVGDRRYIVPTMDGAYHPVTGTPFETVASEKEAVKRWMAAGLTEEQARNELSLFYRIDDSGVRAVDSWSGGDGPMCVNLDSGPDLRLSAVGSFPASRSAERSEALLNSKYRLLTADEVEGFERDRQTLSDIRSRLNE